jgi:hypothetical protein
MNTDKLECRFRFFARFDHVLRGSLARDVGARSQIAGNRVAWDLLYDARYSRPPSQACTVTSYNQPTNQPTKQNARCHTRRHRSLWNSPH